MEMLFVRGDGVILVGFDRGGRPALTIRHKGLASIADMNAFRYSLSSASIYFLAAPVKLARDYMACNNIISDIIKIHIESGQLVW